MSDVDLFTDYDSDSDCDRRKLSVKKKRRVKKKARQKYRRRQKSFCKDLVEELDGSSNAIIKKGNSIFPSWFRF